MNNEYGVANDFFIHYSSLITHYTIIKNSKIPVRPVFTIRDEKSTSQKAAPRARPAL